MDMEFVQSQASFEWYTPAPYVDPARELMGGIDLDPASCRKAQQTVQASAYYGLDNHCDGLALPWRNPLTGEPAQIFNNPPYGRQGRKVEEYVYRKDGSVKYAPGDWNPNAGPLNQDLWVEKALAEYKAGHVAQAVLLLSAATDTNRFHPLADRFPVCFVDHRIPFVGPDGKKVSRNTKGSIYVYLPPKTGNVVKHVARFCLLFEHLGTTMVEAGKLASWALSVKERQAMADLVRYREAV